MKNCINCSKVFTKRHQIKFCSSRCKTDHERNIKINEWLNGNHDGMRGKTSTARWIKWWIIKTYGEKCVKCGWNEINLYTKKIPLELNHIDGDHTNNKPENLELLCPNCHSLTPSYKGANKKKGRPRSKYYRGT